MCSNLRTPILLCIVNNDYSCVNNRVKSTTISLGTRKQESSLVTRPLLRTFIDYLTMERNNGIPNPNKYESTTISNLMPSKKLRAIHLSTDSKRIKNSKTLFNIKCPAQRSGITGAKLTKMNVPITCNDGTMTRNTCNRSQRRIKVKYGFSNLQKTVLLKSKQLCGDGLSTEDILRIKSKCWTVSERKNHSVNSVYPISKKKIVLKLNYGRNLQVYNI